MRQQVCAYRNCSRIIGAYDSRVSDKLIRFRLARHSVDPSYVRIVSNAADTRRQIERHCATTAGNIGIGASTLKTVQIPVPSLAEQRQTVAIVDRLVHHITAA